MRKKILIVDDEITGRLLEYNLKKEGYEVYSVFNGKEAIAKAEKTSIIGSLCSRYTFRLSRKEEKIFCCSCHTF